MKRNTYYPSQQNDQIVWLTTFANEIQILGPGIGLTPAQIAAIVADCLWLVYLLQSWLPATRNWSQTGTNTLAAAQTGDGSALMVLPVYVTPALPNGATPVNTGALLPITGSGYFTENASCTGGRPLELLMESRMRRNSQVRFGGQRRGDHRPTRPAPAPRR